MHHTIILFVIVFVCFLVQNRTVPLVAIPASLVFLFVSPSPFNIVFIWVVALFLATGVYTFFPSLMPKTLRMRTKLRKKTELEKYLSTINHTQNLRPNISKIEEPVRAILRRQVPPQQSEGVDSWLGGRPRMPSNIPWPRRKLASDESPKNAPLHFFAQICCSSLPADLWGGLGPRSGWLLLFMDARDPGIEEIEEQGGVAILHISTDGPERAPPDDILPVSDLAYTNPYYDDENSVPKEFRGWPIDIVTVPNNKTSREATDLYAGSEINGNYLLVKGQKKRLFEQALDLACDRRLVEVDKELWSELEPYCRHFDFPHAMGGARDDVQDGINTEPTSRPLLFQVSGDDMMAWNWGNSGVWYFTIQVDELEKSDFENVSAWLVTQ